MKEGRETSYFFQLDIKLNVFIDLLLVRILVEVDLWEGHE